MLERATYWRVQSALTACTGTVLDAARLANAVPWRGSAVHGGVPCAVEMLQDKEMGRKGGQRESEEGWPKVADMVRCGAPLLFSPL